MFCLPQSSDETNAPNINILYTCIQYLYLGARCYDEQDCYKRSKMKLGSSKDWAKEASCGCMNFDGEGNREDCHCIYMPYGDGASFSGFRKDVWPVPGGGNLTFRGIKNFDATIAWALEHGLTEATEFVLAGGSAGGLSTFLHADRVAAVLRAKAPNCKKIRAAPVVGYFLDHGLWHMVSLQKYCIHE